MARTHDDFEELHGLLSGAKERYRSVRAEVVHTVDATLAREANRHFVDWRFDQGNPGMGVIGKPGPPEREDFYYEYEELEERAQLWHQRPDRWREEIYDAEARMVEAEVYAGANGPRWSYTPQHPEREGRAVYMPIVPINQDVETRFSFLLDPSEYLFAETFWDGTITNKTGRKAIVSGRGCVEIHALTVSWGYPPYIFSAFHAGSEGATDHMLLMDEEVGTILRVAARLEGREFRVAEVVGIAYDEEFPEGTFRLEVPGVEFRRFDVPDLGRP